MVQDPAHPLVCRYAAFRAGVLAYGACAAGGGKAVMLERLGARVVAGDARRDRMGRLVQTVRRAGVAIRPAVADLLAADRKSTRLNSSHDQISYAVFCLKKKKKNRPTNQMESTNLLATLVPCN